MERPQVQGAIQGAILGAVGTRWTKVASVIAKVAHALRYRLPSGDEGYEAISREIYALVQDRRLIAYGNIKDQRFSEIRRATVRDISHYDSAN